MSDTGTHGRDIADASRGSDAAGDVTKREAERTTEDRRYQPVIVKRVDVAVRHPDDTLELAIREGVEQSHRSRFSLLLSAVAAGAILSFTALAVGVVVTIAAGVGGEVPARAFASLVYPIGFVLCLMSGTQLFTEHTALAVYPVMDRKLPLSTLLRVWVTVFAGNAAGCLLGAGMLAGAEGVIGASAGYAQVALHLIDAAPLEIFVSAVLAGWLMALGGWLVLSTPPDASQILIIYLVTFLIGFAGLHHSIAGTAEVLVAAFTGAPLPLGGTVLALTIAVLGNLAGGGLFVAVLNYAHIRKTQETRLAERHRRRPHEGD